MNRHEMNFKPLEAAFWRERALAQSKCVGEALEALREADVPWFYLERLLPVTELLEEALWSEKGEKNEQR